MKTKIEYVVVNYKGGIVCVFSTAEAAFKYRDERPLLGNAKVCIQTTTIQEISRATEPPTA